MDGRIVANVIRLQIIYFRGTTEMKKLNQLFANYTGKTNPTMEELPTSGSHRKYYRLQSGDTSLVGVEGESKNENHAFIELDRHFYKKGLNVPKVVAVSDDEMFYLQEDLGDKILFDAIKAGRLTGVFGPNENLTAGRFFGI
jgi:aminoglycoside/choline kinase family phosphotransferase